MQDLGIEPSVGWKAIVCGAAFEGRRLKATVGGRETPCMDAGAQYLVVKYDTRRGDRLNDQA